MTAPTWESFADQLHWDVRPERTVDRDGPLPRWFPGGQLNVSVNAVDRHLAERADQPALFWEGEPGDRRTMTYAHLHGEVSALAGALVDLGIGPGDRVGLHMGLLPEVVVAMLACARIGAVHAILPAVLPVEALAARLADLGPRVLITQDGAWRHGVLLPLKARADEAITAAGSVEHTVVVRRTGVDVPWYEGDRWYHELLAAPRPGTSAPPPVSPVPVASDHPYLVTHLANRRGHPTGLVHGTAGLVVYTLAIHQAVCRADGVLWTPSELAWLACQTHGILGPLLAGGTAVIYEGMLDTPTPARAWEIMARYHVTTLLATPSVVRALMRWVEAPPPPDATGHLELAVTAGEPIDADTVRWLTDEVGRGQTTVTNAWGQTELGGLVALDHPAVGARVPDAGLAVVDAAGRPVPEGAVGDLVLTAPWPARALGILDDPTEVPGADPDRPGLYVTGDRARTSAGRIEFLGRVDRVFSVSGQLVSAAEVRNVLAEHPFVTRAEVVDRPDPRTGRAVVACIAVGPDAPPDDELAAELRLHVHETLGGLSQPQTVAIVERLPDADEVGPGVLRRALEVLTATAIRPTVTISADQLQAVLATFED